MSNVIRFLESLGRDTGAGALESPDFASRIASLDVEPQLREAMLAGDVATVAQRVGARASMMIFLAPTEPDNDKPDEEDAPDSELRNAA